ncbi:hypothetical protein ACOSP7_003898 [Xanthoceras sorbifolium]
MEDPQEGGAVIGYPAHVPTSSRKPTPATSATAANTVPIQHKIIGICLIILIGLSLIIWIAFVIINGNARFFHCPEFEIHSFSVRPINISSSHITGEWSIRVSVINPNSNKNYYLVYFQEIEAGVFYKECLVTSKRMKPIINDRDGIDFLEVNFDASSEFSTLCADSIETDWSKEGKTKFTLVVRSVAKVDPSQPLQKITATCNEIEVGFSSNSTMGSMVGNVRDCDAWTYDLEDS